jgi:hypothetical protein
LAECFASALWNPWEVVRQRLQIAAGAPQTFSEAAMDIIAESGVRGLYSGLGAYMALWGCYSPIMFVIYEQGITFISRQQGMGDHAAPSLATSFAVGSFAGAAAAILTSPLDVVKTRIQIQTPNSMTHYDGILHGLREVYQHEGPRVLYQGLLARSLNMGLANGIMLACYGTLRNQIAMRAGWIKPAPAPAPAVGTPRFALQSLYMPEPQLGLFAVSERARQRDQDRDTTPASLFARGAGYL